MSNANLTFEALVNAYSADLYRYAYWLCREKPLAEDLVQETFMRAWRALDQLDNQQSAKAWLIRILRRELSRHLGKNRVEMLSLDSVVESIDHMQEHPGLGNIETWTLQRALKTLPEHYLEPLVLQVIAGYSCEEIAQLLGISTAAVMTRVCRARTQLRQELTHETKYSKRVES